MLNMKGLHEIYNVKIEERRNNSILPSPLARLIHNRITYVSFYFTRNYLAHFTPDFLFTNGAPHKQHHVQGIGELYAFQAPFLIIGLISEVTLDARDVIAVGAGAALNTVMEGTTGSNARGVCIMGAGSEGVTSVYIF